MSSDSVPWSLLEAYGAVVKTGSLSGASRLLRLAQPTVRGQIDELERIVGTSLFVRVPAGLKPLPGHEALVGLADLMEVSANAFVRRATSDASEVKGPVRITCPSVFGVEILPAALEGLRRAWPGLEITLSLTNQVEDILHLQSDIAVRLIRPKQEALLAKKVRSIEYGFFAAKGSPGAALAGSPIAEVAANGLFILQDRERTIEKQILARGISPPPRAALRTDDDLAQLAAVRAGIGIGVSQTRIAARYDLVRLCPELSLTAEVWVAMHENLKGQQRMRVVFDWLVAALD